MHQVLCKTCRVCLRFLTLWSQWGGWLFHRVVGRGGLHKGVDISYPCTLAVRTHQWNIQQSCNFVWMTLNCCCCCWFQRNCCPDLSLQYGWNCCWVRLDCLGQAGPVLQKQSLPYHMSSSSLINLHVCFGSFSSFCSLQISYNLVENGVSMPCGEHTSSISSFLHPQVPSW